MKTFIEVAPKDFTFSPFTLIGQEWMLIAAQKDGKTNAMTASWGGLGCIWAKNVAYIFVRKSRYTKEFIDGSDTFSLTFFDTEQYRKMLGYMGRVSGRDEDKIATAGLTVRTEDGVPYFDEAKTVLLCKKLSRHPLSPEGFLSDEIEQHYGDHDYHDMYVGEITKIMTEA
ncbi:MAG: flavin reductase [Oscillospiraceae bacterium]|nr:flavin reductase [Oscillospiraceae bacterium]